MSDAFRRRGQGNGRRQDPAADQRGRSLVPAITVHHCELGIAQPSQCITANRHPVARHVAATKPRNRPDPRFGEQVEVQCHFLGVHGSRIACKDAARDQLARRASGLNKTPIKTGEIDEYNEWDFILTVIGACIYPFIASPLIEAFSSSKIDVYSKSFLTSRKEVIVKQIYYGIVKKE